MARRRTAARALIAFLLCSAMVVLGAPAGAAPAAFPGTPLPGDRLNGVGYTVLVVGDTVIVGGQFTAATAQDGSVVGRPANLAAFDASTGRLRATFRADTDGPVRALATDGATLYVGGSFTSVNGTARARLAAVDLATGAVRSGWRSDADGEVHALALGGGRLFAGGSFRTIGGVPSASVASVSPADGSVSGSFDARADDTVRAVEVSPDGATLWIGGSFTHAGGSRRYALAALSPMSGAARSPVFSPVGGPVLDLAASPDGRSLAVGVAGTANEGAWYDAVSGGRRFGQRCDGDGQAVTVIGDSMFSGFHEGCEGDTGIRLTSNDTRSGVRDPAFRPAFDRFWGVWALDGDASTLAVAGDFTRVGGVRVQGLAIFRGGSAVPPPAPPAPRPNVAPEGWVSWKVDGRRLVVWGHAADPDGGPGPTRVVVDVSGHSRTELPTNPVFLGLIDVPPGEHTACAYAADDVAARTLGCVGFIVK